ncbi:heparinase II/III domain-containing protein [Parasphaerochaeta coccoides]|uniref:Heparinase II/III family protein n=1 Tax=Parasphaerochaeta coccoides (strain ATCC BAA-1237 / DSM 17374 / SPN1) TaxID=760011 RepID=F4GLA8_PARC1|nr:heparinase II/III family protein [Parasphaerochaeta coccoides]AEC02940.1 Heparinase II/III family protein [Parasphaerochaeta coccoides DSM 17374]
MNDFTASAETSSSETLTRSDLLRSHAPRLSPIPGHYRPFPAACDRKAWESLPSCLSEALVSQALTLGKPYWPPLPPSLYRDFSLTGNRVRFQTPYFERRRNLSSLILAECVLHDGTFMQDIMDGINAICAETAWQLPAHNNYVRDSPPLPAPDPQRPVLDLFACETGAILALCCHLLGSELDGANPSIVSHVWDKINERIIRPYLGTHFWWMGSPDTQESLNNWTPWCTQNVLIAACIFSVRFPKKETLREIMGKALSSLDYFVASYGEDGCCSEGAQYYRHAGICLFSSLDIMCQASESDGNAFWSLPKLRNMALYIRNVHASEPWYINFADCSATPGPCGAREFLVAEKIGDENLARVAAHERVALPPAPPWDENNIFNRLQDIFTYERMLDVAARTPANEAAPPDIYYPSNGLFIARDSRFCVGVKAGDNDDSHNHNDVGSVTVYAAGCPLLIDLGVETYTRKTFSPERYEIWTMQSAWHNLPTFGNWMQHDGSEYKALDVSVCLEKHSASISMDIAGAYPPEARIGSYRRTVRLDKEKSLVITDSHSGAIPPTLSLLFAEEPVISETTITVAGHTLYLKGTSGKGTPCSCQSERVPVTDDRLAPAWGTAVWRVLVKFTDTLEIHIPWETPGERGAL